MRRIAAGIAVPIAGALLICAFASIWPLRLDIRSLQDMARVQRLPIPHSSGHFVFFSAGNDMESARTATFGLKQLTFPDGSLSWYALKEQCTGAWTTGFTAVDTAGAMYDPAGGRGGDFVWAAVNHPIDPHATFIYDTHETRAAFESRLPALKSISNAVIVADIPSESHFVRRAPAGEFTFQRVARISALLGSWFALMLALTRFKWNGWLAAAVAVPLAVVLNFSLTYLLHTHWTSAILWLALLAIPSEPLALPKPRLIVLCGLALYALLFLARLDFDGDFFNNWLPQGRFHYLLGHHDPSANLRYGEIHAASYPPGYGIVLSTLMWTAEMNPRQSFLLGADSSFAILLYRLLICALNAALLCVMFFHLRRHWAAAALVALLLIHTTAGQHIAAETLLFPLLATAIVLIAMRMPAIGVAIAVMSMLVKWEAGLIAAFAVFPWLRLKELKRPAIVAAISLIPVLIWKLTLTVHNQFFFPPTITRFTASLPQLPSLAGQAVRLMLEDGRLLLLVFALPAALYFRLARQRNWTALPVPLGIAALCIGFILIFLFANYDPPTYLLTSYPRLIMVPVFGAILYCAETAATQERE